MRAKLPIIKAASDTYPTRYSFSDSISKPESRKAWIKAVRKITGNVTWLPEEELIIESSKEIVKIMESNSDFKGR